MNTTNGVIIMTSEAETANAVSNVLAGRDRLTAQAVSRDIPAMLAEIEEKSPAAVLVDIDAHPTRMLSDLESIINRFQQVRFVVISRELRSEWVLQAMQAGARHYLVKSAIDAELVSSLDRIIPNGQVGSVTRTSLVSVFSASGGCGTTTLAVNLAYELSVQANQPTLLIDLDVSYGSAASLLGLEGQYGVAEVLADGGRIDADLVKSTALRFEENIDVLISPASPSPSQPAQIELQNLPRLLHVARTMYHTVVIDAPRMAIDTAAMLADASVATLLVLRLNVVDLRTAKAMISDLVQRGVSADGIIPIISRFHKRRSMITLKDAQRALGNMPLNTLPCDERRLAKSINYGQPLAQCVPRSRLRRRIRSLASSVYQAGRNGTRLRTR